MRAKKLGYTIKQAKKAIKDGAFRPMWTGNGDVVPLKFAIQEIQRVEDAMREKREKEAKTMPFSLADYIRISEVIGE